MKYYTYISLAKLEMLYNQLQITTHERELSWGFDIKLAQVQFKHKSMPAGNTITKLNEVIRRIEKSELVGGIEEDKPYINGTVGMRFGGYAHTGSIAFWGKSSFEYPFEGTALALAGSAYHLIGEQRDNSGHAHSHSLTEPMVLWFLDNLKGDTFSKPNRQQIRKAIPREFMEAVTDYDIANGAYLAATQMAGQTRRYEFLAKVLHRSEWPDGFRGSRTTKVILGSPLYVCAAD